MKQVRYKGVIHQFPDDATDDEIAAALDSTDQPSQPLAAHETTWSDRLKAGSRELFKAAMDTTGGNPNIQKLELPSGIISSLPLGAGSEGLKFMEALRSGPIPQALEATASRLKSLLPSTERAGAKFSQVMGAAKDVPIDLSKAEDVVSRAQELEARGSSTMPRVMKKFVQSQKPVTAKFAGTRVQMQPQPMTYEAGRDFASAASAQSAAEIQSMSPAMKSQVNQFAKALKEANRSAAEQVGMGDVYDSAMKEYRQAKTLEEAKDVVKRYALHAAIGTGVLYGIEREVERLFGR